MTAERLLPHGFTNRDLRALTAQLPGKDPSQLSAGQMTTTYAAYAPTG